MAFAEKSKRWEAVLEEIPLLRPPPDPGIAAGTRTVATLAGNQNEEQMVSGSRNQQRGRTFQRLETPAAGLSVNQRLETHTDGAGTTPVRKTTAAAGGRYRESCERLLERYPAGKARRLAFRIP